MGRPACGSAALLDQAVDLVDVGLEVGDRLLAAQDGLVVESGHRAELRQFHRWMRWHQGADHQIPVRDHCALGTARRS